MRTSSTTLQKRRGGVNIVSPRVLTSLQPPPQPLPPEHAGSSSDPEQQRVRRRRDSALHGWHDDGEEASREGPGRMHEHSSAQVRHQAKQREKSVARRSRNKSVTTTAMMFSSKLRISRGSKEERAGPAASATACRV